MALNDAKELTKWMIENLPVFIVAVLIVAPTVAGITWWITNQRALLLTERLDQAKDRISELEKFSSTPEDIRRISDNLQEIQNQLKPINLAMHVDKVSGALAVGGNRMSSGLSEELDEVAKFIEKGDWESVRSSSDKVLELYPLLGGFYAKYLYYVQKGYTREAIDEAKNLIELSNGDRRFFDIYNCVIDHYRAEGRIKDADDLEKRKPEPLPEVGETPLDLFKKLSLNAYEINMMDIRAENQGRTTQ